MLNFPNIKSSSPEVSCKKGVLKNFIENFIENRVTVFTLLKFHDKGLRLY